MLMLDRLLSRYLYLLCRSFQITSSDIDRGRRDRRPPGMLRLDGAQGLHF